MIPRRYAVPWCSVAGSLYSVAVVLAYIDPGSGSFLLQALVGGVAALVVLARAYWRRAAEALRGRRRDSGGANGA